MKKDDFDIVAITHRFWIDGKRKKGGFDKVLDYCVNSGRRVILIEHPLIGLREKGLISNHNTVVTLLGKKENKEIINCHLHGNNLIFNWLKEIRFNIVFLDKVIFERKPIFFSSDPLNNITGMMLKHKFRRLYFHCVDYSSNRFGNFFTNLIYTLLHRISLLVFDHVGIVSLKICRIFISRGCRPDKIIYLPNSPVYEEYPVSRKDRFLLISTGGTVSEKYRCDFIIDLTKELKTRIEKVKVYLLGGLEADKEYVKRIKKKIQNSGLKKNIVLTGFLEEEKVKKYLLKAKIGLSFYSDSAAYYTVYGDSLKIREYAVFGIPTISDGRTATDGEMLREKAGLVVRTPKEAARQIYKLLKNDKIYKDYQKNCLRWAKKMDKRKILEDFLKKLEI